MKLSKQERIGVVIILAIVILALGAFLLVKPKYEELKDTQATLEARENQLAAARRRQQTKVPLREQIEQEYEEGAHLADMFFPELTAYDAHTAFIDFIKQLDIPAVVEEVSVSDPTTTTLSVSFYTPSSVSYALKTYVTQGLEQSEEEIQAEQRTQALRSALNASQTIGASSVSFTVTLLSRDDMIAFVDAVNDYKVQEDGASEKVRKAISVGNLSVDYNEVSTIYGAFASTSTEEIARAGRAALRELGFEGYEVGAEVAPPSDEELAVQNGITYTYSDTLTFLSIVRMQNPKAQLDAQDGITDEVS